MQEAMSSDLLWQSPIQLSVVGKSCPNFVQCWHLRSDSACICNLPSNNPNISIENLIVSAELGIDIPGILKRSTCIASSRTHNLDLEGLDLGGPLIFVLLLACIHLLVSFLLKAVHHGMPNILCSKACTAIAVVCADCQR